MTYRGNVPINGPLVYMGTTIPAGMTIAAYRRSRPPRPRLATRVRSAFTGKTL